MGGPYLLCHKCKSKYRKDHKVKHEKICSKIKEVCKFCYSHTSSKNKQRHLKICGHGKRWILKSQVREWDKQDYIIINDEERLSEQERKPLNDKEEKELFINQRFQFQLLWQSYLLNVLKWYEPIERKIRIIYDSEGGLGKTYLRREIIKENERAFAFENTMGGKYAEAADSISIAWKNDCEIRRLNPTRMIKCFIYDIPRECTSIKNLGVILEIMKNGGSIKGEKKGMISLNCVFGCAVVIHTNSMTIIEKLIKILSNDRIEILNLSAAYSSFKCIEDKNSFKIEDFIGSKIIQSKAQKKEIKRRRLDDRWELQQEKEEELEKIKRKREERKRKINQSE